MRGKRAGVVLATAVGLLAAWSVSRAEEKGQTVLSAIRPETTDRSTRLTVEASGPLTYSYYSPDPLTLIIDIPEVDSTKVPAKLDVASPEVESVRITGMARADGRSLTRVEVRLASLVLYHILARENRLTVEFDRAGERRAEAAPAEAGAGTPPATTERPAAAAPVPPAPEAQTPTAPQPGQRPATAVKAVTHGETDGQLAITVTADGVLAYEDFFLANPERLVVDFSGVTTPKRNLVVDKDPVRKIRMAQYSTATPRVARLVLDLARRAPYRIVEGSDGVKILFDSATAEKGQERISEPLASLRSAAEPAVAAPIVITPPALVPVPSLPAEPPAGSSAFDARGVAPEEKKYTGQPISMDFKDGDLQDIFRLFADISGLNVVVNPGVAGKVTLKLTEVPWDQALDLILKTNGLGMRLEDNVIRIAKLADLAREEKEKAALAAEAELAGELVEMLRPVSYAKAKDLSEVIKKAGAVSRRGSIHIDERTNTIIMKDLPRFVDRAKGLINELDRATRQVEIEARIVVTTRNFSREMGIQWGFLNQRNTALGNSTGMTFPNTMTVGGAGTAVGTANVGEYVVNLPATAPTTGVGLAMGSITGAFNLDVALSALEKQGRGRILSTPKITTQDNQVAEIKQGLQFPILVEMNNTVTLTYKDATLTLKVTPQITEANTVILTLQLENNAADFSRQVRGAPSIQIQEASTVVLVSDGETAVVGGVYKSQEDMTVNRTPFFSRIPLLGYLFQSRAASQENQELLLFITPHIVKG
jgi:type IV pilus secretin PilQ/predicted competence protein